MRGGSDGSIWGFTAADVFMRLPSVLNLNARVTFLPLKLELVYIYTREWM